MMGCTISEGLSTWNSGIFSRTNYIYYHCFDFSWNMASDRYSKNNLNFLTRFPQNHFEVNITVQQGAKRKAENVMVYLLCSPTHWFENFYEKTLWKCNSNRKYSMYTFKWCPVLYLTSVEKYTIWNKLHRCSLHLNDVKCT